VVSLKTFFVGAKHDKTREKDTVLSIISQQLRPKIEGETSRKEGRKKKVFTEAQRKCHSKNQSFSGT
jgi:hypothetical protein